MKNDINQDSQWHLLSKIVEPFMTTKNTPISNIGQINSLLNIIAQQLPENQIIFASQGWDTILNCRIFDNNKLMINTMSQSYLLCPTSVELKCLDNPIYSLLVLKAGHCDLPNAKNANNAYSNKTIISADGTITRFTKDMMHKKGLILDNENDIIATICDAGYYIICSQFAKLNSGSFLEMPMHSLISIEKYLLIIKQLSI